MLFATRRVCIGRDEMNEFDLLKARILQQLSPNFIHGSFALVFLSSLLVRNVVALDEIYGLEDQCKDLMDLLSKTIITKQNNAALLIGQRGVLFFNLIFYLLFLLFMIFVVKIVANTCV